MSSTSLPTAFRGLRTLCHYRHYQFPSKTTQIRTLWNGATQPYINHAIPHGSTVQQHQASQNTPSPLPHSPANEDASQIRKIHTKYIQDLLSQQGQPTIPVPRNMKSRSTQTNSLSEPPVFRTDGPLTPYPISLDTGERLEPKHATRVRIVDRRGAERSIVVAEVDDQSGNQRSILLALDLQDYSDEETAVGRRITAEEMYATLGIEAQGGKV